MSTIDQSNLRTITGV